MTGQSETRVEQFEYLDCLRESGATNMFGAASWLQDAFDISKPEARSVLRDWMATFDRDVPAAERAALPAA